MKKLCLMLTAALLLLLCACTSEKQADLQPETPDISESAVSWDGLTFDRELPLSYATQFSVSYAGDDYTRITIGTDQDFLLVAENAETPEHVPESVTVLHRPLSHIYLVASAAMDYFDHLGAVGSIALSGLKEGDWYIEGTWTGGGGVRLPYIGRSWDSGQQTVTASQLAECWFLSAGESHEWRLPNMIYARPSAELREMLAALTPEQAAELEAGLRAVWDDPLYADMFPGGFDAKLSAD